MRRKGTSHRKGGHGTGGFMLPLAVQVCTGFLNSLALLMWHCSSAWLGDMGVSSEPH
jgi:hypothetical protein